MADMTPRKFSEKIAVQNKKSVREKTEFDKLMSEIHCITKKDVR